MKKPINLSKLEPKLEKPKRKFSLKKLFKRKKDLYLEKPPSKISKILRPIKYWFNNLSNATSGLVTVTVIVTIFFIIKWITRPEIMVTNTNVMAIISDWEKRIMFPIALIFYLFYHMVFINVWVRYRKKPSSPWRR